MFLSIHLTASVSAHEVRPAVADVTVGPSSVTISISLTAEALVAGIDLDGLEDTNDAPEASVYDDLRALDPAGMADRFKDAWPDIAQGLTATSGGQPVSLDLKEVVVQDEADVDLLRETVVKLSGVLPSGGAPVVFGWAPAYGPVVVRQISGDNAYSGYLTGGASSEPMPRDGVAGQTAWKAFLNYVVIGFEHIVPKGLDHILFVLGLFFFSLNMRPLLYQITAFTVAHTVTLALATLGLVSIPASVVEPLIALSIVYIAVENVIGGQIGWRRVAVVFGFGLLHGLGFASVLGDIGLSPARFLTGLIGFNVGVELGQLAVIAAAFLLVGLPFGLQPWYRRVIAVPASVAIGAVGMWWTVERVFL